MMKYEFDLTLTFWSLTIKKEVALIPVLLHKDRNVSDMLSMSHVYVLNQKFPKLMSYYF